MVDLHCDESDDPLSRHVETLAFEAQRLGLGARATGSHLTSMHSMDNYYVSKLLPLIAESGICAIANPLINLTLQGRHDTYPRRRGMTRVAEMRALGIPVALGQDCVMDPWYSLGGADMLDVAHMAVHGAPMTSREAIRWTFDAVTEIPARILGLDGYGLERRSRTPTWCFCRRPIRSRPCGCARPACWSSAGPDHRPRPGPGDGAVASGETPDRQCGGLRARGSARRRSGSLIFPGNREEGEDGAVPGSFEFVEID